MFELGDEISYKNIIGIVIDVENEIIFDDNNKYIIVFEDASFLDDGFETADDLKVYLELVNSIECDTFDVREK